jgi:thiamine-monophosphate kinase
MQDNRVTSIQSIGKYKLLHELNQKLGIKNTNLIPLGLSIMAEGIDFDLNYFPLKHLGYKSVVCQVSKVIEMGNEPEYISVVTGLSNRFSVEAVNELYSGINLACQNYELSIVSNDIVSSSNGLIISISCLGKDKTIINDSPQKGDVLCVTGDLGAAYIGLQILIREKRINQAHPSAALDLEKYTFFIERQIKPEARIDILRSLIDNKVQPTSMFCINNGLASSLLQLAQNSNLGIMVYEDKVPINQATCEEALNLGLAPPMCAFNGGEDYELLFSVSQKDFYKIEKHNDISFIGYLKEGNEVSLVTKGGNVEPIVAQSW